MPEGAQGRGFQKPQRLHIALRPFFPAEQKRRGQRHQHQRRGRRRHQTFPAGGVQEKAESQRRGRERQRAHQARRAKGAVFAPQAFKGQRVANGLHARIEKTKQRRQREKREHVARKRLQKQQRRRSQQQRAQYAPGFARPVGERPKEHLSRNRRRRREGIDRADLCGTQPPPSVKQAHIALIDRVRQVIRGHVYFDAHARLLSRRDQPCHLFPAWPRRNFAAVQVSQARPRGRIRPPGAPAKRLSVLHAPERVHCPKPYTPKNQAAEKAKKLFFEKRCLTKGLRLFAKLPAFSPWKAPFSWPYPR